MYIRQLFAQKRVGGNAAGKNQTIGILRNRRTNGMIGQNFAHGFRKGCGNVGNVERLFFLFQIVNVVDDGGFGTAETEVKGIVFKPYPGKYDGVRVSFPCRFFHFRAAGVGQTENTGNLVKAFARGIVPCATENPIVRIIL